MMSPVATARLRRAFRSAALTEVEVMYGSKAREEAETALTDGQRLDVMGAAVCAGIPLVPDPHGARDAAKVWGRETGWEAVSQ